MNPTVFHIGRYRFFFFSREEERMHVHVFCGDGEAKFWLEPTVSLAEFHGIKRKELNRLQKLIENRQNEIKESWQKFFKK